jgi:hypothetical protein
MLLYYNADSFGLAVTVKNTVWAVSYKKSYRGLWVVRKLKVIWLETAVNI